MTNGSLTIHPINTGTTTGCLPAHIWPTLTTATTTWVAGTDTTRTTHWHHTLTTAGHTTELHTTFNRDPETFTEHLLTTATTAPTVVLWIDDDTGHLSACLAQASAMHPHQPPTTFTPPIGTTTGTHLIDFIDVVDRNLSPGGCPWALQQTHTTLAEYALEETHELLDAISTNNRTELREELGDVLLQVFWHARLAQNHPNDPFTIDDVAATIAHKIRTRRPHVFAGDTTSDVATNIQATDDQWNAIKKAEKQRDSCLDGIAPTLPALLATAKTLHRANNANLLDTALGDNPVVGQLQDDVPREHHDAGEYLIAVVHALMQEGISAEIALRDAMIRATQRVREAEQLSKES